MNQYAEYAIVKGDNPEEFSKEVNDRMRADWALIGGLQVVGFSAPDVPTGGSVLFIQAMGRPEQQEMTYA